MKKLLTISTIVLVLSCWSSMLIFSMNIRPAPRPEKTHISAVKFRKAAKPANPVPTFFNLLDRPFSYAGNTLSSSRVLGNFYEVNSNYIIKNSNTTLILPQTYYIRIIPHYSVEQSTK